MSSDVGLVQLRELSVRITKGTTPSKGEGFVAHGVNYIKSESITADGSIDTSKFAFIDTETHDKLARSQLRTGNVLFSMAGMYLGKTAVVLSEHLPANTNQAVGIITLDESKADPYFVHYSLQSPACRSWVLRSAAQSAQPNFNLQEIGDLKIPAFPLTHQKEIANVLRMLDNRITLLRETNATLEAIAQALFKSWFVDFDPVRAKQQGQMPEGMDEATAALFPDSLEESELGLVPQGWSVSTLESLMDLAYGKALKSTDRIDGPFPVYGSGGITGFHNVSLVAGPSIIVGRKGTVGSLYWEDRPFYPIDTVFYVKTSNPLTYCFYLLQTLGLQNMNTDAAVPGLNRNNAYRLNFAMPPMPVLVAFDNIATVFRSKIFSNNERITCLTTLRDSLLPRLISGKIRITEVGNAAELSVSI